MKKINLLFYIFILLLLTYLGFRDIHTVGNEAKKICEQQNFTFYQFEREGLKGDHVFITCLEEYEERKIIMECKGIITTTCKRQ